MLGDGERDDAVVGGRVEVVVAVDGATDTELLVAEPDDIFVGGSVVDATSGCGGVQAAITSTTQARTASHLIPQF